MDINELNVFKNYNYNITYLPIKYNIIFLHNCINYRIIINI